MEFQANNLKVALDRPDFSLCEEKVSHNILIRASYKYYC